MFIHVSATIALSISWIQSPMLCEDYCRKQSNLGLSRVTMILIQHLMSTPKEQSRQNNAYELNKQYKWREIPQQKLTGCRGSASIGKRPLTISDCLACVTKLNKYGKQSKKM